MKYHQKTEVEKLYYVVGEAAEMLDVARSNVRYWLIQFGIDGEVKRGRSLNPKGAYRKLTRSDLNKLFEIKRLLHDEGYTIRGAKKKLEEYKGQVDEIGVMLNAIP